MGRLRILVMQLGLLALLLVGCTDHPTCDGDFEADLVTRIAGAVVDDVELSYDWKQGHGRGNVAVRITGRGESKLLMQEYGRNTAVEYAEIPAQRILELLALLKDSNIACAETKPRERCVVDIGKTIVRIRLGSRSRELYWDEYRYTTTSERIDEFFATLHSLKDLFGVGFDWGPYGWSEMPCPDELPPRAG